LWKFYRDAAGIIGDQFALVGSLFSALAFLGLLVALFLQQRQLRLQEKELRVQIEVQKLTAMLSSLPGLIRDEESRLVDCGYAGSKRPTLSALRHDEEVTSEGIEKIEQDMEVAKARSQEITPQLEKLNGEHNEKRITDEGILRKHSKLSHEERGLQITIKSSEKKLLKLCPMLESISRLIELKSEQRSAYDRIKGYDIPDSTN
jgi:predicted DNA-binding transcriptional regulator